MSDDKMAEIDAYLERFYARNPQASPTATLEDTSGISPLDMGTVSWEEVGDAVDFPTADDMDFQDELLPILRKRLVWDIVPRTDEIKKWHATMGITPGSDEGDVIEEVDADARRTNLLPIMPLVHIAAMAAGDVVSRAKMLIAEDTDEPGTLMTIKPEHDVTAEVASGTLAVIANLLEMNILTYGSAVTGE